MAIRRFKINNYMKGTLQRYFHNNPNLLQFSAAGKTKNTCIVAFDLERMDNFQKEYMIRKLHLRKNDPYYNYWISREIKR